MEELYNYKVKKLEKVVDGDTVYVTVSLGFHVTFYVKLRLSDVDTPELNSRDEWERTEAKWFKEEVRTTLEKAIANNQQLYLYSKSQGKYGRWIGDIFWHNKDGVKHTLVNQVKGMMIERGLMS